MVTFEGSGHVLLATAQHEQVGIGGIVSWQPAKALCRWLSSITPELRGASVLELGSGTGACGLFAAALGASRVLLTDDDVPTLLALARRNADENAALSLDCTIDVQPFVWGSTPPDGPWDWVIGSDLTYVIRSCDWLCQAIQQLLSRSAEQGRSPRVILAHQDRPTVGSLEELTAIATTHGLSVNQLLVDRNPSDGYPPASVAILELVLSNYSRSSEL